MLFYILSMVVVVSIILLIGELLKCKPKWLINLFVDIWNKPYPKNRKIDDITLGLVMIAYVVILIISIIKKY
jgi:hypothetical protein